MANFNSRDGLVILLLRLEGPLQSWGLRSQWDERDTAKEPTKSGIIGLIGCALGYSRSDTRLAELDSQLKIGVRVEREGISMQDFHTVQGTPLTKADGKTKNENIVSNRMYLEDTAFLVALEGNNTLIEEITQALQHPKWPLYLGRKACIATRPILDRIASEYSSIEEALEKEPWDSEYTETLSKKIPEWLRCVVEDKNGNISQYDSFQVIPARMHAARRLREYFVANPAYIETRGDKI